MLIQFLKIKFKVLQYLKIKFKVLIQFQTIKIKMLI